MAGRGEGAYPDGVFGENGEIIWFCIRLDTSATVALVAFAKQSLPGSERIS